MNDLPKAVDQAENANEERAIVSLRALILSSGASVIIGKGGQHITELRTESGARLMISAAVPGCQERVLTVSGPLEATSRAFGLLVRRLHDEPFDQPSLPGSQTYTVRLIVPNARMGGVIGRTGVKIKGIQEASGARLHASGSMLPGSTERVLSVTGVADAVHIAVYHVGLLLSEPGGRGAARSELQYHPGGASMTSGAYSFVAPAHSLGRAGVTSVPLSAPPGSQTQQVSIPDDLVGSIIGKGGGKINEIRHASGTTIKIADPSGAAERIVAITGLPAGIQIAVNLLHNRVEEERRLRHSTDSSS